MTIIFHWLIPDPPAVIDGHFEPDPADPDWISDDEQLDLAFHDAQAASLFEQPEPRQRGWRNQSRGKRGR